MATDSEKTILVVDDNESNLDMILAILKAYDVIPSTSGKNALEMVTSESIDLILLDILMPDMDGFEVCRHLKADPKTADIPIIFITAKVDEESIETAYALGGADYVTKPFRPRELLARVKVQLRLQDLISELNFLATRDSLTGIYNRRKFFEIAQEMYAASENDLYAVMIDIDHFKRVNDQYGHSAGDCALKTVTQVISDLLPGDAVFGRMGGEEFALLFKGRNPAQAKTLVNHLRETIARTVIEIGQNDAISCTISSGVACKQSDTTSLDALLKQADLGLYEAKESGRDRSIFRGH